MVKSFPWRYPAQSEVSIYLELGRWAPIKKPAHLYAAYNAQIFVEFGSADQCSKAHSALAGRKFANRVVVTSFFDLVKYHNKEFVS